MQACFGRRSASRSGELGSVCPSVTRIDQTWIPVFACTRTLSVSLADFARCNLLNLSLTDLQHTELFYDQPLK